MRRRVGLSPSRYSLEISTGSLFSPCLTGFPTQGGPAGTSRLRLLVLKRRRSLSKVRSVVQLGSDTSLSGYKTLSLSHLEPHQFQAIDTLVSAIS